MKDQVLRPGLTKCLRCRKPFDSRDICSNRICPPCTRANQREYIPRVAGSKIYGDGGSTAIEHDD